MPSHVTVTELKKMTHTELRQEIRGQQSMVRKMRMEIELRKEKDTAKYRRERRQLARMETALRMVLGDGLKPAQKPATVPAPARRTARSTGSGQAKKKAAATAS